MKKTISIILCLVAILGCFGATVSASNGDIALCNNNVMVTDTLFYISAVSGKAEISVCYYGYVGITTGGTITTVLDILVDGEWSELYRWVATPTTDTFIEVYEPILAKGDYRLNVEYRISGTGGPDDVITELMYKEY